MAARPFRFLVDITCVIEHCETASARRHAGSWSARGRPALFVANGRLRRGTRLVGRADGGGGAHGFFEVTNDVTDFTKAAFLARPGKRTEVFARFSTVAGEQGFPELVDRSA
jgi:hypothetical protein